jgi:hypothetical protein
MSSLLLEIRTEVRIIRRKGELAWMNQMVQSWARLQKPMNRRKRPIQALKSAATGFLRGSYWGGK